jgi:hypothetical protein
MTGSPAITINVRRSTHQVTMEQRVTKSDTAGEVGNQPGSTLSAPPNTVGCRLVNPRDGDFASRIQGPYDLRQGTNRVTVVLPLVGRAPDRVWHTPAPEAIRAASHGRGGPQCVRVEGLKSAG